jgi:hypothetical protein
MLHISLTNVREVWRAQPSTKKPTQPWSARGSVNSYRWKGAPFDRLRHAMIPCTRSVATQSDTLRRVKVAPSIPDHCCVGASDRTRRIHVRGRPLMMGSWQQRRRAPYDTNQGHVSTRGWSTRALRCHGGVGVGAVLRAIRAVSSASAGRMLTL